MTNLDQVQKLLEGGYNSVPQPRDTEKYGFLTIMQSHTNIKIDP